MIRLIKFLGLDVLTSSAITSGEFLVKRNKSLLDKDVGKYKAGRYIKSLYCNHLSHQQNLKDVYIAMSISTYVGNVKCDTVELLSAPLKIGNIREGLF